MISILSKLFIKNKDCDDASAVRNAYGSLCSILGIVLNIVLFGIKYFAGIISGSIAVTADAFNNLSDAGSSVITLAGIRMASKKPDKDHPFGHGRMEYLSGLAVSVIIILVGVELFRTSVDKIINPTPVESDAVTLIILAVSIAVKFYMFIYNRSVGKKINSAGMKATALDCIGDAVATAVVLASTVISRFTDVQIDGWCGILVSAFIIVAGIKSVKETVNPLLGMPPEKEFIGDVERITMSFDKIIGIHDLIVHDYGPGRVVVSLHAEVSGNEDIFELHDIIDNAEHMLADELGCMAVIHMDPIETDNEVTAAMHVKVAELLKGINEGITIHDFRMVPGTSHTNLIFDAVIPHEVKKSDSEVRKEICALVSDSIENCNAVVNIDRPFV
ncbi:MAG: cation transporter [Clostridia bacterium]|nr:cation transporter [Clostridia bacterium]